MDEIKLVVGIEITKPLRYQLEKNPSFQEYMLVSKAQGNGLSYIIWKKKEYLAKVLPKAQSSVNELLKAAQEVKEKVEPNLSEQKTPLKLYLFPQRYVS